MAKLDIYFTIHMWAEGDKYRELNGTADMQEALDEWIDDVMGGSPDEFNYRAELTNHITKIVPTHIILKYIRESAIMSSGVLRRTRRGCERSNPSPPIIIGTISIMNPVLVIHFLTDLSSPWPKNCEVTMPPPLPIPLQSAKKRKVTEPVAPTAASASFPIIRPTITESARLYNC